jgi:hypothetical protein
MQNHVRFCSLTGKPASRRQVSLVRGRECFYVPRLEVCDAQLVAGAAFPPVRQPGTWPEMAMLDRKRRRGNSGIGCGQRIVTHSELEFGA